VLNLPLVVVCLWLYLQQVAGYLPLKAGLALLPESQIMFALSSRFGALADRLGPRVFMGAGPLIAGAGMLMLLSVGVRVDYLTQLLPGILLFSLGLSITVAPLTAAILAGVDQTEAGIGSAVNNAVARVAGLIATVAGMGRESARPRRQASAASGPAEAGCAPDLVSFDGGNRGDPKRAPELRGKRKSSSYGSRHLHRRLTSREPGASASGRSGLEGGVSPAA
jgi:hypothetical protein